MNKNKKLLKKFLILVILLLTPALVYSNYYIDVENITFRNSDVPEAFDGVRIVHLSDYHNHGGKYDDKLVEKITQADPDYIFLTGDIADRFITNIDKAENFLKRVSGIASCYMVWGNHEKELKTEDFEKLKSYAENCGITVLDGDKIRLKKENEYISVTGNYDYTDGFTDHENDDFNIWLHHFPHDFKIIANTTKKYGNQMDLMFSGHAHGGLIRLPFIKGIYAPDQGFFPKYTSGIYEYNGSSMIVSRGVGNVATTLRLFDTFHVVVCTLERS